MVLKQEDFTEQAREALGASQQMVLQMRHSQWDAEHLLLGLLQVENSLPAQMLQAMEIDVSTILRSVTAILEETPKVSGPSQAAQIFATPRVVAAIERARTEADRLKDDFIGTDHLMVSLVADDSGKLGALFKEHGITQERIYQALQQVRGSARVSDPRAERNTRLSLSTALT